MIRQEVKLLRQERERLTELIGSCPSDEDRRRLYATLKHIDIQLNELLNDQGT